MINTPRQELQNQLLAGFDLDAADPQTPWDTAFRQGVKPPSGLGPLSHYDILSTVMLAGRGFKSPYWAPKAWFFDELGARIQDGEAATLVRLWKYPPEKPESTPFISTYPVYNLDQTSAAGAKVLSDNPETPPLPLRQAIDNVRQLIDAYAEPPTILFVNNPQPPIYDLHDDALILGSDGVVLKTPADAQNLLEALVAATAHSKRCRRRLHPPARELFVSSLTAAAVAHACGLGLPTSPDLAATCHAWIRTADLDLFRAAHDADDAIDALQGCSGRQEALYPDQLADYNLAQRLR